MSRNKPLARSSKAGSSRDTGTVNAPAGTAKTTPAAALPPRGAAKAPGVASKTPGVASKTPAAQNWRRRYRLIDSGGLAKLEEVGGVRLSRPSTSAVWGVAKPEEWKRADMVFVRTSSTGGEWKRGIGLNDSGPEWIFDADGFKMNMKLTDFGHIGLFPEQMDNWDWLTAVLSSRVAGSGPGKSRPRVMNLFGYTGGSTLACLAAGAEVCHVDASKAAVAWARENVSLSGFDSHPVRWIVDDVRKFVRREAKRGSRYDGIILDPPTFGRGASGQVWKIEKDLTGLMAELGEVLSEDPLFFLLTCNTAGFTPLVLEHLLGPCVPSGMGTIDSGEMSIPYSPPRGSGLRLPAGAFARWSAIQTGQGPGAAK